jgi:hypothetical protein
LLFENIKHFINIEQMKSKFLLMQAFVFGLSATFATLFAAVPTITSFTPTLGIVGEVVTITGTNFNTNAENNSVYFGATKANVTSASATTLTVEVPAGATFKPISVSDLTTGLTAYSSKPFIVKFNGGTYISNTSFGGFGASFSSPGTFARSIDIGDIDNDGKNDIVLVENIGKTSKGYISVLRNGGPEGIFSIGSSYNIDAGIDPTNCVVTDFNADGKLDIISIAKGGNPSSYGSMYIFKNKSKYSF